MNNLSILLSVAVLFTASTAAAVDEPKYQEGEKWRVRYERKSTTFRSDALPSGIYEIVYRNGKFLWHKDKVGNGESWEGLREEDAPVFYGKYNEVPFLTFPLNVGDKRTYRYFNRLVGRTGMNLDGAVTIEKMERFKTEAGEFEAYKHVMTETGGRGVNRMYIYYYAPDCKCIPNFSAEFGSGTGYSGQLLSYEPGK